MITRKSKRKDKNNNVQKSLIFVLCFLIIMAIVTWFFLPGFKSLVNGESSPFEKILKYTPAPQIIEQDQKEEILKQQQNEEAIEMQQNDETDECDIGQPVITIVPKSMPIDGYIADSNSYKSDNIEVEIEKVNENDVTYYVADVKIKDMSDITSATYNSLDSDVVLKPATVISQKYDAILAVNTDFYTYKNRGQIIRNGSEVLNNGYKDFLCLFDTGKMDVFNKGEISTVELLKKGAKETFEFGPVLVSDGQIDESVYDDRAQSKTRHPRCGVGYYNEGHYLFIVVDGRKEGYSVGVTIPEFAQIFNAYGVELAYNLDGGGSATMTFMGELVNKPEGNNNQRKIDNILYIKDTEYIYNK